MNSRSRKFLNMLENESQPNNYPKSAIIETWLDSFDAENQDNDHDYPLETSPSIINNICITSNFDLPDKNELCDQENELKTCLSTEDKVYSTLSNINTENMITEHIEHDAVATNLELCYHGTDNDVTKSDIDNSV